MRRNVLSLGCIMMCLVVACSKSTPNAEDRTPIAQTHGKESGPLAKGSQPADGVAAILDGEGSWEASYRRGQKLLDDGELEEAIRVFDDAIRRRPTSAETYNARGVAFLRQNRLRRALDDFNEAIHLDPNVAKYYANRALVFRDQDKYKSAIADHNRAIKLSPTTADNYEERATTFYFMGDEDSWKRDDAVAERLRTGESANLSLSETDLGINVDRQMVTTKFEKAPHNLRFGSPQTTEEGYTTVIGKSDDGMTNLKLYERETGLFRIDLVAGMPDDPTVVLENTHVMFALLDVATPAWSSREEWLANTLAKLGFVRGRTSTVQPGIEFTVVEGLRVVVTCVKQRSLVTILSIMRADDPSQFPLARQGTSLASSDQAIQTTERIDETKTQTREVFRQLRDITQEIRLFLQSVGGTAEQLDWLLDDYEKELESTLAKLPPQRRDETYRKYAQVHQMYCDSLRVRDVQLEAPELFADAKEEWRRRIRLQATMGNTSTDRDEIAEIAAFELVIEKGHAPYTLYPKDSRRVTGLGDIQARYPSLVGEFQGYSYVKQGAVEALWRLAEETLIALDDSQGQDPRLNEKTRQRMAARFAGRLVEREQEVAAQRAKNEQAAALEEQERHVKQAASMVRLAKQFLRLDNKEVAKKWLNTVIDEFGDTPSAKEAEELLKSIE